MTTYKNEIDPPPALEVDLYINAPPGEVLPEPHFYRVEWAIDEALFNDPAARTLHNFYPLNPDEMALSHLRTIIVSLDLQQWHRFLEDRTNRNLYWRIGSGENPDPATWDWSPIKHYQINHMPTANAGPPRTVKLGLDNTINNNVSLDGTASSDVDENTMLNYQWQLIDAPPDCIDTTFLSEIQINLDSGNEEANPFLEGAYIPDSCQGTYLFRLRVEDDDPLSSFYFTQGQDLAQTTITVGQCSFCLLTPTTIQPVRVDRFGTDNISILINWSMEQILYDELRLGFMGISLQIAIKRTQPEEQNTFKTRLALPHRNGQFFWTGFDNENTPALPGTYDLELEILDAEGQTINIPDYITKIVEPAAIEIDGFGWWSDLMSFRPSQALQQSINARGDGWACHRIEDGWGDINLDCYPVLVSSLPIVGGQQLTAAQLLAQMRLNINLFIDTDWSDFEPYDDEDEQQWLSANPLGSVIHINFNVAYDWLNPDDGSVLTSLHELHRWRFSTVRTPLDLEHAVSGNREFGYFALADGGYIFYTRGADRATGIWDNVLSKVLFFGADKLWLSLQAGITNYVNLNNGEATSLPPISTREDWDYIRQRYHRPTVAWL